MNLHSAQLREAYAKPHLLRAARRIARRHPTGMEQELRLRVAIENDQEASGLAEEEKQAVGAMIGHAREGLIPFPTKGDQYPAGRWAGISFQAMHKNPRVQSLEIKGHALSRELRQFFEESNFSLYPVDVHGIFYRTMRAISHAHRPVGGGYPWAQAPTCTTLLQLHDNLEDELARAEKWMDAIADLSLYDRQGEPQAVVDRLKGVVNVFDIWKILSTVHGIQRPWGSSLKEEGLPDGADVAMGLIPIATYQEARKHKEREANTRYDETAAKRKSDLISFATLIERLGTTHAPTVSRYLNMTPTGFKLHPRRGAYSSAELSLPCGQRVMGKSSIESVIKMALEEQKTCGDIQGRQSVPNNRQPTTGETP